jgi:CheY-like chemotaxis protein
MDLQMPVMDGYAATQYIRNELRLSIPIIAMTATALIGEQLRCFEVGMNDYMTKPFEFTDLIQADRFSAGKPPVYPDYRSLARSGPIS